MSKNSGLTLLELIVAGSLAIIILTTALNYLFKISSFWQKNTQAQQEQAQIFFALDNIKAAAWSGEILSTSTDKHLDIQDDLGRTISFYQKNQRICMYKNKTFYLTTKDLFLKDLLFSYTEPGVVDSVSFETIKNKIYIFYL
ncbi:PilW family protein [Candidatus Margulisiibacteriota bacterium]